MSRLGHTTLNIPDHTLVSELTGQALRLQGHGQGQDLRTELSSLLILTLLAILWKAGKICRPSMTGASRSCRPGTNAGDSKGDANPEPRNASLPPCPFHSGLGLLGSLVHAR